MRINKRLMVPNKPLKGFGGGGRLYFHQHFLFYSIHQLHNIVNDLKNDRH